jgi:CRP/FNR family transcriptional regulator, cyclic AMP receptor protein
MDDKLERILAHPLLPDLPDSVMAEIRQLLVRRSVRAGAHIFSKGGQPSGWFGVLEGEVAVVTSSASGIEIVLTILDAGDWFGEVAILAGAANSHDAIARGNCEVAFIPTSGFRQLLARQPELHGRFVTLLAQRVLAMADSQAMGSVVRRGRISQEEYALLVGATRQSVNQELRRWEKAGWIGIGYGGVEVIDREALKREIAGN